MCRFCVCVRERGGGERRKEYAVTIYALSNRVSLAAVTWHGLLFLRLKQLHCVQFLIPKTFFLTLQAVGRAESKSESGQLFHGAGLLMDVFG